MSNIHVLYRASDVLQTFTVRFSILNLKCSRTLVFRGNQTKATGKADNY